MSRAFLGLAAFLLWMVAAGRAGAASQPALMRVQAGNRDGYAFHVGATTWLSAMHVVVPGGALSLVRGERRIPCRLAGTVPSADIAVLDCPGTKDVAVLALADARDTWDSQFLLEAGYLDSRVPGVMLRRPVTQLDLSSNVADCKLGVPALLLADTPQAGDSGAPLIARFSSGREVVFGMWAGVWSSTSGKRQHDYGVAVTAPSLVQALQPGAGSTGLQQSLFSCAPNTKSALDLTGVCADAYRAEARGAAGAARACQRLPLDVRASLQAGARAEQLAFESALGPAGWVIAIDAAFAGQRAAMHHALTRNEALISVWEKSHGDELASAFEYDLFESALLELTEAMAADAGLSQQVAAFVGARIGSGLAVSKLSMRELMRALALKTVADTPRWMYCALAGGARRLEWATADARRTFAACMSSQRGWSDIVSHANAALKGAKCAEASVDLGKSRWLQVFGQPRLQAAFWIGLDKGSTLRLDAAFGKRLGLVQDYARDFGRNIKSLRHRIRLLLGGRVGALAPEVKSSALTLQNMLGREGPPTLRGFLGRNLCRLPMAQRSNAGVSVDYFNAVDAIRVEVCKLRPSGSVGTRLKDWCSDPTPRVRPPPTAVHPTEAARSMSEWFKRIGISDWFTSVTANATPVPDGGGRMFYWLVLGVAPEAVPKVVALWTALNNRLQAAGAESLDSQIAATFALMMNVRRADVAVYRDSYCDDLRVRLFRGGRVATFATKCAASRASSPTGISQAHLDALAAHFLARTRSQQMVPSAVARWVFASTRQGLANVGEARFGRSSRIYEFEDEDCSTVIPTCSVEFGLLGNAEISRARWWVKLSAILEMRPDETLTNQFQFKIKAPAYGFSPNTEAEPKPSAFKVADRQFVDWFGQLETDVLSAVRSSAERHASTRPP